MTEQRANVVAKGPLGVSFGPFWLVPSIAATVTNGPRAVDGLRFTVDGQKWVLMVRDQMLAPTESCWLYTVHRAPCTVNFLLRPSCAGGCAGFSSPLEFGSAPVLDLAEIGDDEVDL